VDARTEPEKFVARLTALYHHARVEHECKNGSSVSSTLSGCVECDEDLKCEGKAYKTRHVLTCPFHSLAYQTVTEGLAKQRMSSSCA